MIGKAIGAIFVAAIAFGAYGFHAEDMQAVVIGPPPTAAETGYRSKQLRTMNCLVPHGWG